MAATAGGQPPAEAGRLVIPSGPSYTRTGSEETSQTTITTKTNFVFAWKPQVIWDVKEVNQMINNENLEYAVIGKFPYGLPDETRTSIALISFPSLPPNFFGEYVVFSLAADGKATTSGHGNEESNEAKLCKSKGGSRFTKRIPKAD
ncbi:hypothetical protein H5410_000780 [Solanum commersonii]|uniref:Uncharacterized protein n=1 Tax=Solanum commersonii TaxID=4109 RepID=A0A9J6AY84_SOLCO|nr:hypothetical protein H5410_000780 [Solanum commersonii]